MAGEPLELLAKSYLRLAFEAGKHGQWLKAELNAREGAFYASQVRRLRAVSVDWRSS